MHAIAIMLSYPDVISFCHMAREHTVAIIELGIMNGYSNMHAYVRGMDM